MPRLNGGQIIAEYLVKEKVPYVFGVSGHGNVGLLEAFADYKDEIKTISVHHEQVAGHMADAYFRVAHRPVATFTSTGPGTANLPMALATALMDSSAFLAITANIPTSQMNRGPFQELSRHYQAEMSQALRPFTKRSFHASRVEMLPSALRMAYKTMMTGRHGPVQLDVPFNLFVEEADVEVPDPSLWRMGISNRYQGAPEDVRAAMELLLNAERPLILVGHGATLSEASAEVTELAVRLNLPVAHVANGKGIVDARLRHSLGEVGRNGRYPANEAAKQCDVLLTIGCRFDDRASSSWLPGQTFSIPPTRLIHVDIDPDEIGRNYPPTVGITGDARTVVRQMLHLVDAEGLKPDRDWSGWWNRIETWRREWETFIHPLITSDAKPIRPERLAQEMRAALSPETIVVPDSGAHHNWMVQFFPSYLPGTMPQTVGFASMGFGACGVLGAKLAAPDRPAVAVVGDGGMLMTPQAIPTAVQYNIPVVWVVWNNYGYGAIRDLQKRVWQREYTTSFLHQETEEVYRADFVGLARAFGAEAARVESPGDIGDALRTAVASNRPYLLEVVIDPQAAAPSVGSWELPPLPPPSSSFPSR